MLQGLPNDIHSSIDSHNNTGKSMWDQIEKQMMGTSVGTQVVSNVTRVSKQKKVSYSKLPVKVSTILLMS